MSSNNRILKLLDGIIDDFAPIPDKNYEKLRRKMLARIDDIRKVIASCNDPEIIYQFALALNCYVGWYVRGDDRQPVLQEVVGLLSRAVELCDHTKAKVELARIMIEDKPVRDLDKAMKLVEELQQGNQLPDWMKSSVEKAKRWTGKIEIPTDTKFSSLDAAPGLLREERTKLRKLLTDLQKKGDNDNAPLVARRLYNLAFLAATLYDEFDGSSGVGGLVFDAASKKFSKICDKFNFDYLGRIEGSGFLTNTDYKRIEKTLGPRDKSISVSKIRSLL